LTHALSDENLMLRARALRSVGELGKIDLLPMLMDHFQDDDNTCRFYAAWSASLFKKESAVSVLQHTTENSGIYSEKACAMALRNMSPSDSLPWLNEMAQNPDFRRMAVTGYGVLGDPVAIPWLIQTMEIPELARTAGEVFSMIAGVDIAYEDLEGDWPEGFEAGPTQSPEDVEMDPDEDLPWLQPELISEWWDKNKGSFKNGSRYFMGKPISAPHLQEVLKQGFLRQRASAAIELAMLNQGQPLFEVRAPGARQQRLLGLKRFRKHYDNQR